MVWTKPIINLETSKRIIGFWHIGALGNWREIVSQQYSKLRESGLYDASQKIVIGFIGGAGRYGELPVPLLEERKISLFSTERVEDYEFPTLARVWREAHESPEPFLCYYLHTKGASSAGTHLESSTKAWREYMEFFNLEKWRHCAAILSEYETCGVELQSGDSHYSGNFWWARSDYVQRLVNGEQYWEQHKSDRLAAEYYVCLARPKAYCFHDFEENLYDYTLPPERYRNMLP